MTGHDIIVIGASAGGIEALRELVRSLPADLPATVFVVVHTSPQSSGYLPGILSRAGSLRATFPEDPEEIKRGHIYVAPPDLHLMILNGHVSAVRGPKEALHRPSVDALFRTAAHVYGPRVVGVVLTGNLDDGTAGLQAIKEKGGIAIVQDPNEAIYPGMPGSAMRYVKVDYCMPLSEIAPLLVSLATDPIAEITQQKKSEVDMNMIRANSEAGAWSGLTCPECGASLWESLHERLSEFRCRVGHSFSLDGLLVDQSDRLEKTL